MALISFSRVVQLRRASLGSGWCMLYVFTMSETWVILIRLGKQSMKRKPDAKKCKRSKSVQVGIPSYG